MTRSLALLITACLAVYAAACGLPNRDTEPDAYCDHLCSSLGLPGRMCPLPDGSLDCQCVARCQS